MRSRSLWLALVLSLIVGLWGTAQGQETVPPSGHNMAEMKFITFPGLPTCSPGSVQSGDPENGLSIILANVAEGCSIPWHWHTPNEHLMMVSGVARVEMKDGKPVTLEAGGFALMPSRHVHQFRCDRDCKFYIFSDAAPDTTFLHKAGHLF